MLLSLFNLILSYKWLYILNENELVINNYAKIFHLYINL